MTNKEILTAVIIEWAKPVIPMFLGNKISNIPVLGMFENWAKHIGIAPSNWSIAQDLSPIIQGAVYEIVTPFVLSRLKNVPDEYIPQMAHGIVSSALQNGKLDFFGGNLTFEKSDLEELKKYLECNLPYNPLEKYKVIKPEAAGDSENNEPQVTNQ